MIRAVILDSGPLGLAAKPKKTPEVVACTTWLAELQEAGIEVYIPEIADYEVRRELLRASKTEGRDRLDELTVAFNYLPLTTEAMRHAAAFWARARQAGYPTAADLALDGDVILAGQAVTLGIPTGELIVATDNVKHLARFIPADEWQNIQP